MQRYHHILDTAAAVIASAGFEQVGTNQIAAAAGVSVGSFYRYFSGKDALADALVERYLENMKAVLPDMPEQGQPMAAVVRLMLEQVLEFDQHNAAFAQILMSAPEGQFAPGAVQMHVLMRTWVEALVRQYHPQLSAEAVRLCAASGMGIVKGMLTMTQPPDLVPLEIVIDETVATLMAYVDSFVKRQARSI